MDKLEKLRRAGCWMSILLGILMLKCVVRCIMQGILFLKAPGQGVIAVSHLSIALANAFGAVFGGYALTLLKSLRDDRTPFCLNNVRRLKVIALLLIVIEPLPRLLILLVWAVLSPGSMNRPDIYTSYEGTAAIAGLAVWCIALVFDYGMTLQNQADETL